jgi:hypothetical protein
MSKQYSILRLTVKIDINDTKEKSFTRAMLRRLNVLFVKCNPKGSLVDILNGNQISDAYEGSQKIDKASKNPKEKHERKVVNFQVVRPVAKPKVEFIAEQEMEPPAILAEFVDP